MSDEPQDKAVDVDGNPTAKTWLAEIGQAQKTYGPWHTRGDKVIKRYKNEGAAQDSNQKTVGRKMALLWANVETEKPALFNQRPVPNISRRNKDGDRVGKTASMVLERCVDASLGTQLGLDTFESIIKDVVEDLLLPGTGIAVEEYKAETNGAEVTSQASVTRYIHWKDWLTNTCRMWSEVWFFAYCVYLTEDEAKKRFGDKAAKLSYSHKPSEEAKQNVQNSDADKAKIWTIWSKRHNKVFMVAEGYGDELLDSMEPPVKFSGFWPFPRPVQATVAKDTIIPSPDFVFYQDQADIIDELTSRIAKLSESLRLRGLYPADMDSLKQLMTSANDTEMLPIENWAMLAERGGADGLVVWFPLKDVAQALMHCIEALDKQLQMLYEITGKSDLMRGSTDPNETKGAQDLKSQYGSLRQRDRQRDIQRFARDMIQLKAEIIAEHFNQQTLAQMSGLNLLTEEQKKQVQQAMQIWQQYEQAAQQAQQAQQQAPQPGAPPPMPMQPPQPPTIPQPTPEMVKALQEPSWDQVIKLLRNDKLRGFTIDVETDSTIEPDQQAEQQKAVAFIGAVSQFLEMAGPVLQAAPTAAPMLGELLMFGVRRFKISEPVETAIEQFTQSVAQTAGQPKPDPKMQAEQVKTQAVQIKAQAEGAKSQAQIQTSQIKAQAEQTKAQLGVAEAVATHHAGMQQLQQEQITSAQEHQQELQRLALEKEMAAEAAQQQGGQE